MIFMAFFEDIGKKITQTGQDAITKTKNMTESARLSGMISDEDKKITQMLTEIGKMYYNLNNEDPGDEYASYVSAIKESIAKKTQFSDQIKKLKGVEKCPNCGQDVPHGVAFCSACGNSIKTTPQQAEPVPDAQPGEPAARCPKCGAALAENARFCVGCGEKISES